MQIEFYSRSCSIFHSIPYLLAAIIKPSYKRTREGEEIFRELQDLKRQRAAVKNKAGRAALFCIMKMLANGRHFYSKQF